MKCPRCKKFHSVEQYLRLEESPEFERETVPVYKCPSCKWIFALDPGVPQEVLAELNQLVDELRTRFQTKESVLSS